MNSDPLTANEILHFLKEPFGKYSVKFRQGAGGKQLAYIDARTVMKRLDEVVGINNWQTEYEECSGRIICKLSLRIDGEWITKCDGAGDTKIEGDKGGISDALKRAAVNFGIGRYLYVLPVGTTIDNMPKWGLPYDNS